MHFQIRPFRAVNDMCILQNNFRFVFFLFCFFFASYPVFTTNKLKVVSVYMYMYKSSVRAIYVNSHTNISGVIANEKVAKVPRPHRNLFLCIWDSKATYYNKNNTNGNKYILCHFKK